MNIEERLEKANSLVMEIEKDKVVDGHQIIIIKRDISKARLMLMESLSPELKEDLVLQLERSIQFMKDVPNTIDKNHVEK